MLVVLLLWSTGVIAGSECGPQRETKLKAVRWQESIKINTDVKLFSSLSKTFFPLIVSLNEGTLEPFSGKKITSS